MRHLILGAGNMVQALTPPFISKAKKLGHTFSVFTPSGRSAGKFANDYEIEFLESIDLSQKFDFIWLGMKPQQIKQVSEDLAEMSFEGVTLVSLLAGVAVAGLKALFPKSNIIRVMPNTPSKVGLGVNGIYFDPMISPDQRDSFMTNFKESGKSFILESEDKIDLITPYSGSGPAYFFEIARILADDLERRGMDKKDSLEIVALTMKGAAEMMLVSEQDPETLRENVTSKGGVTFEALKVLEENQLSTIMERAIDAALKRNSELKEV